MQPSILITGGAKRIGSVIARRFGAAGWHVVLHYGQSRDAAEELAAQLPSAETVSCDLADGDASVSMAEALAARLPDWRVLVNCAAVFRNDSALGLDPARSLADNDSTGFFEALGDLLQPGPTLTNVNDCRVILIEP